MFSGAAPNKTPEDDDAVDARFTTQREAINFQVFEMLRCERTAARLKPERRRGGVVKPKAAG
jgi:hypothetical protein